MITTILNGLLPVAFGITLGWFAGRINLLKTTDAGVLAAVVMRFALPLALFEGAVKTPPDKLDNLALVLCMIIGLMGTYVVALGVGRFVFKHDLRTATIQALVCAYPDISYFGAPVLAAVFGPVGFLAVLTGNLISSILMLPATIVLTQFGRTSGARTEWRNVARVFGTSIGRAVINPMVWLPVLGMVLSMYRVAPPGPVLLSIDLIGRSAGGISLFALGLMLYGERLTLNINVLTNLGIKNFLQPALMALGAVLVGLKGTSAHQAIITGAIPSAAAAAMFALRAKVYIADATATILIGTVLGIGTVAALIALLK